MTSLGQPANTAWNIGYNLKISANGLFEILHLNCFKSMEIPGVEIQAGLGVLANVGSAGRGRLVDAI